MAELASKHQRSVCDTFDVDQNNNDTAVSVKRKTDAQSIIRLAGSNRSQQQHKGIVNVLQDLYDQNECLDHYTDTFKIIDITQRVLDEKLSKTLKIIQCTTASRYLACFP